MESFLNTSYGIGQILYDAKDTVIGIATNDMGVAKDGSKKEIFQCGVELKGISLSLSLSLSLTHTHTHTHTLYKISQVGNLSPILCSTEHLLSLDIDIFILDSSNN